MKDKILSLLEADSRLTASKIAVMLGMEEGVVAAAIREMEDENIRIYSYMHDILGSEEMEI